MAKALSVDNLMNKKYRVFDFSGSWRDAFSTPEKRGVWFIWGNSGNGKTSFIVQLIKYLSTFTKVDFVSLEEGSSLTMRNAFVNAGFVASDKNVRILDGYNMDLLKSELNKKRSAPIVVIDSFQYTQLSYKEYILFKEQFRNKLLIFISHASGSQPSGRPAKSVMFDSTLKIWVEGYKAFSKGRFIGPTGQYTIWDDGAEKYWLSKVNNKTP